MTGFNVTVSGDEAYRRKLAQFELHLADLSNFWGLLVPIFIGWMGENFKTEGAWGGAPWAPLSPTYAIEKARAFPGRSILIREGTLRRAASEPRREQTPLSLTLWIDDPVAAYHQEGNDRGMPARPLIPDPLPESARIDVEMAASEYVSVLVRRLGL